MKVKPLAFATQGMCCPVDEIESVAADDSSGSSSASFRTLDMLLADAASVPPTRVGRVVTFGNGSYSVLFDLRPAVGTPEPAGWVLLTSGIALLAWRRRRLTAH